MLRLQFLLWDLFTHSTVVPLDATHPEELHSQWIWLIISRLFLHRVHSSSRLPTSHPVCVLRFDKCNLFWMVILMKHLQNLLACIILNKRQQLCSFCQRELIMGEQERQIHHKFLSKLQRTVSQSHCGFLKIWLISLHSACYCYFCFASAKSHIAVYILSSARLYVCPWV